MIARVQTVALLCCLALGAGKSSASGDIYVGRDASGNLFFTDTPPSYGDFEVYLVDPSQSGHRLVDYKLNFTAYDKLITTHSHINALEPALVKAVVFAESAFNPSAVSKAGAQGLMQLMPHVQANLGVHKPFDPQDNIAGGTKLLGQLMKQYGKDTKKALAAYNAGPKAVERYGGVPPFEETQHYVNKVLRLHKHFKQKGLKALP